MLNTEVKRKVLGGFVFTRTAANELDRYGDFSNRQRILTKNHGFPVAIHGRSLPH